MGADRLGQTDATGVARSAISRARRVGRQASSRPPKVKGGRWNSLNEMGESSITLDRPEEKSGKSLGNGGRAQEENKRAQG